ncbi:MAG: hypothetical protein LBH80_00770 [Prevotellaceae bacterium]|jgi:hypothetical protein|nr:hypothetical protein [Prevotellaceae bacterium]
MTYSYLPPKFLILIACVLFFAACGNSNEPKGGPVELQLYVDRFLQEAKSRGYNYAAEAENVTMKFGTLSDGQAGYTDATKSPVLITIDKLYWDNIGKFDGADLMKEFIVFHELGHGILNRSHENPLFDNGDWKTMMRGGDVQSDEKEWNVNYRGERRNYYLNELFGLEDSKNTPPFASLELLNDTSGFEPKYRLKFDGVEGDSPALQEDANRLAQNDAMGYAEKWIDNGLHIKSNYKGVYNVLASVGSNFRRNEDYAVEITFECATENNNDQFGLFTGSCVNDELVPGKNIVTLEDCSLDFMHINNNKKLYIGNKRWYSFYIQLNRKDDIKNKNTLKIINISNKLYYFINGAYSYSTEIGNAHQKGDGFGLFFGFSIPSCATIHVNDLLVYKRINNSNSAPQQVYAQTDHRLIFAGSQVSDK